MAHIREYFRATEFLIVSAKSPGNEAFTWIDVYDWLEQHPDVEQINAEINHKSVEDVDHRFQKGN